MCILLNDCNVNGIYMYKMYLMGLSVFVWSGQDLICFLNKNVFVSNKIYRQVNSRYLKVKIYFKLLISQSEFSGLKKYFTKSVV